MIALVDHLWQSTLFCAGIALIGWLTRKNSARVRLWFWRAAALKFLLPFAWLFALGESIGFPIEYTEVPTSPAFLARVAAAEALFAPAHASPLSKTALESALMIALLVAAICARWIASRLRAENVEADAEFARRRADVGDTPPGAGFIKGAFITASAGVMAFAPLFAGALADRERRHELLVENAWSLRGATVQMNSAAPGLGTRIGVVVSPQGVSIHNTNIQSLVAIAYGISPYSVWSNQYVSEESNPGHDYWLTSPRYDVIVHAPLPHPDEFDTFALHQPITKLLADRFGLELYLNAKCQPPCGVYQVKMPDAPL